MRIRMPRLTRRRLCALVVLAATGLAGLVLAVGSRGILSAHYHVDTPAGRVAYLHDLGWDVQPESETVFETVLPDPFDDVMEDYNTVQRAQGFDLEPYAGRTVTGVTYELAAGDGAAPEVVQLWIHDGVVIGGDVHSTALDGELRGIV